MLQLENIKKDYSAGENSVHALRGVSVEFRKSEFVAILGPSGCGKTTLLNIIGGLDKYSEGDLVIDGRSTKNYNDRDWDTYRNHSVGFVFQSYNLIPHQTVLQNVELALTLTGVSKAERRSRAKEALEQVGLGDQLRKRPSEMSGGQMQRVAIARAIVNNPDIVLADEPTGALDTETSVQVMDILKEISKNRLVIMVTHNPELAEKYATRTVKMLDGLITDDSAPLLENEHMSVGEETARNVKGSKVKKPTMSIFTSFGLSLKNLITKKGRTALTSFAGSIGIIGIALIFAVSNGMTAYINTVQEDTLSSYPLTIEERHMDMGSLLETFMGKAKSNGEHDKDAVYQKAMIYELINSLNTAEANENDLKAFKKYIEADLAKPKEESKLSGALNGVQYTYDTELLVYTENVDGTIIRSDTEELMQELLIEYFGMDLSSMISIGEDYGMSSSMMMGGNMQLWQELLPGRDGFLVNDLLYNQYDVICGSWPTKYNEIVLVVDENNELDDVTLYALGLKSKEDIDALADAAINKTEIEVSDEKWSYEDILDMEFRTILGSSCYTLDEKTGLYTDLRDSQAGLKYLYDNGLALKVSGIIRPNEDAVAGMIKGSIAYTSKLTEYMIEEAQKSSAAAAQKKNPSIDIFTGLPFKENTGNLSEAEKAKEFKAYIEKLDTDKKADAYVKIMSLPSDKEVEAFVESSLNKMSREDIETTLTDSFSKQTSMDTKEMADYIKALTDEELEKLFGEILAEQYKASYAQGVKAKLEPMGNTALASALDMAAKNYKSADCARYYDEVLEFSESDYEGNMKKLGVVDLESPSTVNLYASSFENKDIIEEVISEYNESVDDLKEITYTDYVGLMMSSVTSIINAITYVLIAFVAVSLIVSSIMIGVITLISVQERTKEIGILRAMGASKKNVSSMFNAETVIIGFMAGLLGVAVTYLLCIPINAILHKLTGFNTLSAFLPVPIAVALVAISVLLTLVAGIIPSRSAAKKDPVVALRSE